MDETGIPLDHRSPRALARRGQKKVRYCSMGNKSQITVVGCINTIGQALPPFVVFEATFSGRKVRCLAQLTD